MRGPLTTLRRYRWRTAGRSRQLSTNTHAPHPVAGEPKSMPQQYRLMRAALAVTAPRCGRYLRNARIAFLAAGLALILTSCGSRNARQLADASARPPLRGSSVIYVVNIPPGLLPVDLANHRTMRPIALPSDALRIHVTSDRRTAYVMVGTSLVPIDLSTGARGQPIAVPAGSSAFAIAPDGRTAYVLEGRALVPIDLRTGTAGRSIIVTDLSADNIIIAAGGRAACLTGTTITASGLLEHQVIEPVDLTRGKAGRPITVPNLFAAAIAPDGRTAYVASGNALEPIDLVSRKVGRSIRLPTMLGIGAIAVTADGRTAYVGNLKPESRPDGIVVPIDLTTLKAEPPIHVPSYPYSITDIVIVPDGRTAYVAAYSAVIPMDLQARKAERPIPMPAGIQAITLAP
jgi:DNA-binding beta-propeller fold protein YncE